MAGGLKIFIEHLEPSAGEWILIEYRSSYRIAGDRLLITGLEVPGIPSTRRRFYEVVDPGDVIILDPQAREQLEPGDLEEYSYVVVGGILGSHPPRGRTRELLSSRFPQAAKRNIGGFQFSIDGSVYMVLEVYRGRRLNEIPVARGVRIRRTLSRGIEHEIYLPYAYPLVGGKPLISIELVRYLVGDASYTIEYEEVI